MKVKNFAPGPSKIPKDILDEISQDVLDFRNLGQSVLELSHRGEVFENILNESKKNLHKILNIPNNFEIILSRLLIASGVLLRRNAFWSAWNVVNLDAVQPSSPMDSHSLKN